MNFYQEHQKRMAKEKRGFVGLAIIALLINISLFCGAAWFILWSLQQFGVI